MLIKCNNKLPGEELETTTFVSECDNCVGTCTGTFTLDTFCFGTSGKTNNQVLSNLEKEK